MRAITGEQQSASEIDGKRSKAGQGQRNGRGRQRQAELLPGGPKSSNGGGQKDSPENHAEPGARSSRPAERDQDQQVDRSVLQEVDRIRKQRNRTDRERYRELD